MPTSDIPPSPFPSRSIRQLKERVANLRVKHNQIYNFPRQHIEPQVNWSTVIEEKQVPRGTKGATSVTAWPGAPAGQELLQLPWRNWLLENFWAAPYQEQQTAGWQGRGRGDGTSPGAVAPGVSARGGTGPVSPVTACFRLYSTALIFYFIPLPTLFQPEKG